MCQYHEILRPSCKTKQFTGRFDHSKIVKVLNIVKLSGQAPIKLFKHVPLLLLPDLHQKYSHPELTGICVVIQLSLMTFLNSYTCSYFVVKQTSDIQFAP